MIVNKRIVLLISLIILLCYIFSFSVIAEGMVEEVELLVEGETVVSDLVVKEIDDNLLIPLHILEDVFELEVEWRELINTINISYAEQEIRLRVGEKQFEIDNEIRGLKTAVHKEGEQIFIPVQFLTEVFNYRVEFNSGNLEVTEASIEIKEVSYEETEFGEKLMIKLSDKPEYDIQSTNSPEQLMIDIYDSRLSEGRSNLSINNGMIFQVRSRQPEVDRSRIILDLYQPLRYNIDTYSKNDSYYLSFKVNPRIIDFEYKPQRDNFVLVATEALTDYQQYYLEEDNKLVVEFADALLDVAENKFFLDDRLFKEVRLSQHNENTEEGSSSVKLVFKLNEEFEELKEDIKLDIYSDEESPQRLVLSPKRPEKATDDFAEELVAAESEQPIEDELFEQAEESNVQADELVELYEVILAEDQEDIIQIKTDQQIAPFIVPLEENSRLVLDFPGTIFRPVKESLTLEEEFIKEVRIAQFNKEITRVVVELEELVNYEVMQKEIEEGYLTELSLNKSGEQSVDLESIEDKIDLSGVDIFTEEGFTNLQIDLDSAVNYEVRGFEHPDRLVVDIMGAVADLDSDKIAEAEGLIEEVRVSQFTINPLVTRVVFDLVEPVAHQVMSEMKTEQIELKLESSVDEDSILKDRLIVVDAGHGGADPGAIGPTGVTEKAVALKISQKLEQLLTESGAQVKMTREADYYVSLGSRAELANRLEADVFVSVHANSYRSNNISGTETYVHPDAHGNALLLAKSIQDSLVQELGLIDRGVKMDQLFVLNETDMPSVLTEVAFLSNVEEEKLLATSEFRQEAAIGIYNGLLNYFNQVFEGGRN
ncbi:N-acetylmuramoyl-L-alanine amidase [Fuchsiella alkaliacetigena]|uniref:N-acetylmuramoyl-L-alanine amidase n=1 Tax=Fuchsiella alkaliacetigena TaxID=957042 RepID=UPI00200A6023|nr:N-acetylmuramoyl-L-alanine amidase [Fuchsiella alkaliacetigena]MCK8824782.1 N-acetylmuramoyl-L-alanine amidase family protein [Fuchsiella alkaliacetigena]